MLWTCAFRLAWRWILLAATVLCAVCVAECKAERLDDYIRSISQHPHIVRYYTFDALESGQSTAASLAGQEESAVFAAAEEPVLVAGAIAGSKAVRLDRGYFQAKPVVLPRRQFTLEMRFRKHGQGEHLGNGRTNGMLFAMGDGYWSGLRLYTDYPNRRVRFEIGRPKPANALGMTTDESLPDGVWHHLAATWDAEQLRVYLNGLPAGAIEYAGEYTPTTGDLRIGYAGAGIGSLKMDVDEVAIYDVALPAEQVFLHAFYNPKFDAASQRKLQDAIAHMAQGDWTSAAEGLGQLVESGGAEPLICASARLGLARSLERQGRSSASIAQYAALYDDPTAPETLREIAVRHCLPETKSPALVVASSKLYRRLLTLEDLTAEQRRAVRLVLAESLLRDGDAKAARDQYREVLKVTDVDDSTVWNTRLNFGHSYLVEHDYEQARLIYDHVATMDGAPQAVRGLALLAVGHAFQREGEFERAADSFGDTAKRQDILPHHRREADERRQESQRMAQNLPARDPAAHRTALPQRPEPAVRFYVGADGDDSQSGDRQHPFASLERARDAIRQLRRNGALPTGGVAVIVRGGEYSVRSTLELNAEDSGSAESPIVYRAATGEQPRFTGGVRLREFSPVTQRAILDRLPEASRNHIVQVDLRAHGIDDLGSLESRGYGASGYPTRPWVDLYVENKAMQLARWPNDGTVAVGEVFAGGFKTDQSDQPGEFQFTDDRPNGWASPDDVWMFGAWGHLWAGRYVKVDAIDVQSRRIRTLQRCSYGYREGQPYYYLNVLEELDRPGEWYLDRDSGVLYLYPPQPSANIVAEFPVHSAPFIMATDLSHVAICGLTFELGRAEGAVITGGEEVLLSGCSFGKLGTNGVVVRGGRGHGVLGCDIYTLGAGGVRLAGGDMKTLASGEHFVENCHIHDFSRVDRVYAPAVHLEGVGLRVAHNLIHDSPHHAMRVEGHEHVIEYNEVHSVVYEFDDQSGIDIYGNPAYRGIKIRYNFWHHIGSGHNVAGQAGIRLDDFISSVEMIGNVFYRSAGGKFGGIQIHGGKDNIADNNLFIDCKSAFSFSPWGQSRWKQRLDEERTRWSIARAAGDLNNSPLRERYPDLDAMAEHADRNYCWRNLVVDCPHFAMRDRGVNERLDNHVLNDDPGFADPSARDFSLPADSAIYDRFGFRAIPFDEIGLYASPTRASWPVSSEITPHYVNDLAEPNRSSTH